MCGIDTDPIAVGYKAIRIQPRPGGAFTHASADLQTIYGSVSSHWTRDEKNMVLDVEIPANTSATIYLPTSDVTAITEGGRAVTTVQDIKTLGAEAGSVVLSVGSGKYRFVVAGGGFKG